MDELYPTGISDFMDNVLTPRLQSCRGNWRQVAMLAQAGVYFRILRELAGVSFALDIFLASSLSSGDPVVTLRYLYEVCGWGEGANRKASLERFCRL